MIVYARLLGMFLFFAGVAAVALCDSATPDAAPAPRVEKHAERLANWPYVPDEDGTAGKSVRRIAPEHKALALRSTI